MTDGPFLCYRELITSSNVETSAFFYSFNDFMEFREEFLFTATAACIEIFKINRSSDDIRLAKCLHLQLFGKIRDCVVFDGIEESSNDRILISLDEGKFVLFQYDSSRNSLKTLWMCNAEDGASGYGADVQLPTLGRGFSLTASCHLASSKNDNLACSVLNGQYLLFCAVGDVSVAIDKRSLASGQDSLSSRVVNHFLIDVNESLDLDGPIIDCCFVSGYSRPVIAILQEHLLPVGHCAKNMNTSVLTVLAVDSLTKSAAILWQQKRLPHDCISLVPCTHPSLTSCVTVISMNAILLVSQQTVIGLATNGFAGTTVSHHVDLQPWLGQQEGGYELDGSRWIQDTSVSSSCYAIVGSLKSGLLLRVGLAVKGSDGCNPLLGTVFVPEVIGNSIKCSTFSASPTFDLWFLGSRQVDSLLLQASPQDMNYDVEDSEEVVKTNSVSRGMTKSVSVEDLVPMSPNSKRQRRLTNNFMDEENYEDSVLQIPQDKHSEEVFLYEGAVTVDDETVDVSKASGSYLLAVVDSIPTLGPVLDGFFCKPDAQFNRLESIDWVHRSQNGAAHLLSASSSSSNSQGGTAASYIAEREMKDCLQVSSGLDDQAGLCRMYSGLSLAKVTVRNFIGATRIFSVSDDKQRKSGYSTLLLGYETRSRVFHCADGGSLNTPELKLKEMVGADSGFITADAVTVGLGVIHESLTNSGISRVCVQICNHGLRLLRLGSRMGDEGSPLQDVLLSDSVELGGLGGADGESILSGEVTQGWVSVMTSHSNLLVLCHDVQNDCLELKFTKFAQLSANGAALADNGVNGFVSVIRSTVTSASLFSGTLKFAVAHAKSVDPLTKEQGAMTPMTPSNKRKAESLLNAAKLQEEVLLYGAAVSCENHVMESIAPMILDMDLIAPSDGPATLTSPSSQLDSQAFLVVTEITGRLSVVQLSTLAVVFTTDRIVHCDDCLVFDGSAPSGISKDHDTLFVVESKLVRLSVKKDPKELSKLVLLVHFSSGDICTYVANECNGSVTSWSKLDQRCINNKRNLTTKSGSLVEQYLTHLNSPENLNGVGSILSTFSELNGANGVLISGNQPLVVLGGHGLPTVLPLGLPELPFVNYGHHAVTSLSVGGIRGVVSLWYEFEDLDAIRNPAAAAAAVASAASTRQNKPSTLGIYQEVADLKVFSSSSISVKKVTVGKTVHRCAEIMRRTDDKTEQALLEKRTFVMSCSEETLRPFMPQVLTPEEMEKEDVLYERYLTSLDSFAQPNPELGEAPHLTERAYSLSLVQGGAAVDTYALPPCEKILDVAVLYMAFEKMASGVIAFGMPIMTKENRVFIAASTSVADRRGEDTQGSGRLLLFGLDFALFQENTSHLEDIGQTSDATNKGHANGSNSNGMDVSGGAPASTSSTASSTSCAPSVQSKFLGAIQPKLKLLWSGPGPATVVKQLGDYILSTVGSTLYVYRLNQSTMELEQVAFHFTQFYITSVTIVKNYIILADFMHSVQLLVWRIEDFSLTQVSKDFDHSTILSSIAVHDGNKLGIVVGDDEGNIQVFQQNPKKLESNKGSRLLALADFHIGSEVSVMVGHDVLTAELAKKPPLNPLDNRPPPPPPRTRKGSSFPLQVFGTRFTKTNTSRTGAVIGTLDGGLGLLMPIEERMYRRLSLLQQIMSITLPTALSLNPKDYRLFKSQRFKHNKMKGVLDGTLLWSFNSLHPKLQEELAAAVGATAYTIKENLHDLDYLSSFM